MKELDAFNRSLRDTELKNQVTFVSYEKLVQRKREAIENIHKAAGLHDVETSIEFLLNGKVRGSSEHVHQMQWNPVEKSDNFNPLKRAENWNIIKKATFNYWCRHTPRIDCQ